MDVIRRYAETLRSRSVGYVRSTNDTRYRQRQTLAATDVPLLVWSCVGVVGTMKFPVMRIFSREVVRCLARFFSVFTMCHVYVAKT